LSFPTVSITLTADIPARQQGVAGGLSVTTQQAPPSRHHPAGRRRRRARGACHRRRRPHARRPEMFPLCDLTGTLLAYSATYRKAAPETVDVPSRVLYDPRWHIHGLGRFASAPE